MNRPGDFWSRRKAKVAEEQQAEARASEAAELAAREAELAEKTDDEILEELGLPDPDTLGEGADFKAFMAKAVPDRIRRRALRRLWLSNPALANLDGLLDYGEDFTDSATVIENLQTAYQVGKGMLAHVEELARQAEAAANAESSEDAPEPETEAAPEIEPEETVAEPELVAEAAPALQEAAPVFEDMTDAALPRRRMSFSFDDHAGGAA